MTFLSDTESPNQRKKVKGQFQRQLKAQDKPCDNKVRIHLIHIHFLVKKVPSVLTLSSDANSFGLTDLPQRWIDTHNWEQEAILV